MNRCSAGQPIDRQEMQVSVNAAACDDGRIRCDDQELIIRNYYLTACADLWTGPGKRPGLRPASTAAVSPSRWQGTGELPLPGEAR